MVDIKQLEKNVSASFSFVKKDLLMVNDSVSELLDKIQHLSMNQAMLLEKVAELERSISNKKKTAKKTTSRKVAKEKIIAKKSPAKKVAKKAKVSKKTSKTPKKVVTETVLYE